MEATKTNERGCEAFGHGESRHGHAEEEVLPRDLPKVKNWAVLLAGLVVLAAFAALFLIGWIPREKRLASLNEETASEVTDAKPMVEVALPKRTPNASELRLPADARAFQETAIYPRATGYLKVLHADIGDRVKQGQLLAEIETPDLDAQLNEARAAVTQAKANVVKAQDDVALAQVTQKRYESIGTTGGVSQQQLDERRAATVQAQSALDAMKANVTAAEATAQRLESLVSFEKVYAPFAGTITARNYDIGALMSAGNSTGKELFRIADTETLRVFVNVPQPYVNQTRNGAKVHLVVRNFPGRNFDGVVARTAGELDPATRTLRTEVDVPNKDGLLFAGMYGEVHVQVDTQQPPMVIPTSAVVFDSAGTKVWVVEDGKVHVKKVTVGRDNGTEMEIASGLTGNEQVVTNPGERLAEGVEVQAHGLADAGPNPNGQPQASAR